MFAYSRCKEFWVSFIEKALAKLYGSYEAIVSGSCVEGLQTLTGEPCEIVYLDKIRESLLTPMSRSQSSLSSMMVQHSENPFFVWSKLVNAKRQGHLMLALCYNKNINFVELQRCGLLRRHIYSVLDVHEFDNMNGDKLNLIKLSKLMFLLFKKIVKAYLSFLFLQIKFYLFNL